MNPKESEGNRFFRYAYRYVSSKTKIDPVSEGMRLRQRLQSLLAGSDFLELESEREREARQMLAEELIDRYGERMKKFNQYFYNYCFARGRLLAVEQLGPFMEDAGHRLPSIVQDYRDTLKTL